MIPEWRHVKAILDTIDHDGDDETIRKSFEALNDEGKKMAHQELVELQVLVGP